MPSAPSTTFLLSALVASTLFVGCSKPKPIEITPQAARIVRVSPAGIDLALNLTAHNPNSFVIQARTVSGTLEVGEVEVGRGSSALPVSIPAQGSTNVNGQLTIGWTNLGALLPFALSNQPAPYRFRGVASVGGEKLNADVPFTVSGVLTPEEVLRLGLRP